MISKLSAAGPPAPKPDGNAATAHAAWSRQQSLEMQSQAPERGASGQSARRVHARAHLVMPSFADAAADQLSPASARSQAPDIALSASAGSSYIKPKCGTVRSQCSIFKCRIVSNCIFARSLQRPGAPPSANRSTAAHVWPALRWTWHPTAGAIAPDPRTLPRRAHRLFQQPLFPPELGRVVPLPILAAAAAAVRVCPAAREPRSPLSRVAFPNLFAGSRRRSV